MLQTLNPEWAVSIARNVFHEPHDMWPLVLIHSPGLGYAFDSDNTHLDSPEASMQMLTALGLHRMHSTFDEPPEGIDWAVELNRDDRHRWRDSVLRGPHPIAPIGPLSRHTVPDHWRQAARGRDWQCQVMFAAGVDFYNATPAEIPAIIAAAATAGRVAGATVQVRP